MKELFDGGVGRWILVAVVLMVLFSSFQLIGEQQRGVVLRFGQFSRILQPGPNFKLPWPIESVRKVNATEIKTFSNQVPVLTRDENIVNVSLNVQYQISDPRKYLFGSRNADLVLEQAAQSAVREQVGRSDLNTVLNNRGPLAIASKDRLQAALDAYNTGLAVTGVTLPDARPPEEVKPAFDEVNGAQQVRERLINEAQAYAAKVVPEARGQGHAPVPVPKATSRPPFRRPRVMPTASRCCRPSMLARRKSPASGCGWKPCRRCCRRTARSSVAMAARSSTCHCRPMPASRPLPAALPACRRWCPRTCC